MDLLDRLVIIKTSPYTKEEMLNILKIRATTEGLQLETGTTIKQKFPNTRTISKTVFKLNIQKL